MDGVRKTTNNGATETPSFEHRQTGSIGAIADWLRDDEWESVSSSVKNASGHVVWKGDGPNERGLNRVVRDLRPAEDQRPSPPHDQPPFVPAGTYTVKRGDASGEVEMEVFRAPNAE